MKRKMMVATCVALMSVSFSGCAALLIGGGAAAGAGAVMYVRGALNSTQEAPLRDVYYAGQSALTDMGYRITERRDTQLSARLKAKAADDAVVVIVMTKKSANVTEISIRYGTFGNETKSQLILDSIRARL